MTIKEIMADATETNQSAVTEKNLAYKKSKKKFRKNLLAKNYEKESKKWQKQIKA